MPVIQFTEADRLAGKALEAGGYSAQITEISGPKASASQKSVSFFVIIQITKGPFLNKELNVAFNTETRSASILGGMQWFPHREMLKIKAAIDNSNLDTVDLNFDTDTLLDKPFDIMVAATVDGGAIVNIISAWLPAGKASTAVPF